MYIDETYLQEMLTTAKVEALVPVSADLSRLIAAAHAETETALQLGGYTGAVPHTVYASVAACPPVISLAALGSFLELAYGRNDLELPENYRAYVRKLDDLRSGKIEIPSVTRSTRRAPGGVSFTESSTDVTVDDGARPQVFSRKAMQGF